MFEIISKPYYQAAAFILLTLLILIFIRPRNANSAYTISGLLYAAFILTNSIFIYFVQEHWTYFFLSLLLSVVYILVAGPLISVCINLMKMEGSGESGMIFLVILYHPPVLLFMILLKWFINS